MNLPKHIIKKSDKWYFNTKTNKYIHCDNIASVCDKYWEVKNKIEDKYNERKVESLMFHKEMKQARKRWGM